MNIRTTAKHSPKYETVKKYYVMGIWEERKVRDAVRMSWITAEEFRQITGKDYEG